MSAPLITRVLRSLDLQRPSSKGRASHLSAASGLVRVGSRWYVVADDEHHLGVFTANSMAPGHLVRLFQGKLPEGPKARKRAKPDLEVLLQLPAFGSLPHGALLALGSGSRPNREVAVLLALNTGGVVQEPPRLFDLSALYAGLREHMGTLNIEGAMVLGDRLRLLQRGNKGTSNAVIDLPLSPLLSALSAPGPRLAHLPLIIRHVDLGQVNGIPLSFTDGAALPDGRVLFTAVAEDTDNSYDDGGCVGSGVGILEQDGTVSTWHRLQGDPKVEGLSFTLIGNKAELTLVTDADDASVAASMLTTAILLD